ncbi:MAG: hypothetical protein N3G20_10010, partial [Verrucomicrobiae bacterium]|nr:hypothetical protein [Verrucomicrobiae bacterium]
PPPRADSPTQIIVTHCEAHKKMARNRAGLISAIAVVCVSESHHGPNNDSQRYHLNRQKKQAKAPSAPHQRAEERVKPLVESTYKLC